MTTVITETATFSTGGKIINCDGDVVEVSVIVEPESSAALTVPLRAASDRRPISAASCQTFLSWASRSTGTLSPAWVCVAMPRWTRPERVTTPAASS